MRQEFYYVRVDINGAWTQNRYRKVSLNELDEIIDKYQIRIDNICSNGSQSAMIMWACFKNAINNGGYKEMCNAYKLMGDDNKTLTEREHELRKLWNEYKELWQIRYYGSVENYYLKKAAESKERFEKAMNERG